LQDRVWVREGENVGRNKGKPTDLVCAGAALNDDRCNVGLQDRVSAEAISISRVAVAIRDSIYDTCLLFRRSVRVYGYAS